jgi:hypothetical protein
VDVLEVVDVVEVTDVFSSVVVVDSVVLVELWSVVVSNNVDVVGSAVDE